MARRPLLSGVPVLGACLIALGCGGDGSEPADPAPAAQPPDIALPAQLEITAPANGDVVQARQATGDRPLTVTGTAPTGTTIRVIASCRPRPCSAEARTRPGELWTVRLRLKLSSDQRSLSLVASDPAPESTTPDSSVVLGLPQGAVTAEEPDRPRRRPAKTKRKPIREATPVPDLPTEPLPIPTETVPRPDSPTPQGDAPRAVQLIGDSLALGIKDLLPGALGGAQVTTDAEIGRSMATGMAIVARAPRGVPLAISLFTNDDPRQVDALERAVRSSVRDAGPGSCAVWATIVRPPLNGIPYTAANARLRQLARRSDLGGRLRLVEWDSAIAQNPSWLAGDEVHGTPAGYRGRAALYARALAGC